MSGHAGRAHAHLSASGSKRWLACTPSAELERMFGEGESSVFAEEGTAAHELADLELSMYLGLFGGPGYGEAKNRFVGGNAYYSREMSGHVRTYLDIVIERINAARTGTSDAVVLIEQRLDFSEWVPEGFGTGDVLIIADGAMEVIDLKYGKGVPVSAEDNPQMRLYGLGALNQFGMLYDVETVRMTIVQPRLDSVSTEEMTAAALLEWAEAEVKPKAALAAAGKGDYIPGDHCRFCKARTHCRARAMANLELMEYEFREASLLSVEEITDVLGKVDGLVNWASDIKGYALDQAEKHGVRFPGWKLVEGRSNRMYADKQAVADTLLLEGLAEDEIHKPRELLGITDMEKRLGKKQFAALLDGLIIKPAGKPVLVVESDKRPELSSMASIESEFGDAFE